LTVKAGRTSFQVIKRVDVFVKIIHSHNSELFILSISTKIPYITEFETCILPTTLLTYVACYHPVISAVPFLNPKARVETYFKFFNLMFIGPCILIVE